MPHLRSTVLLALSLGCAGETVVYDRLDGGAWGPGRAQWSRPDAGAAVAFVTNSRGNSVAVLDLTARRVLATVPVPVVPLAENGPHHLAIDVRQGVIYTPLSMPAPVSAPGPHGDHGNALVSGVFVKRDLYTLRLLGQVEVDPNPGDMVLSHDRRRAYVSHYDMARALSNVGDRAAQLSNVVEVDTERMVALRRIPVCVAAHGMALSLDDRTLYIACTGDDALAVVDLAANPAAVRLAPLIAGAQPAGGSPTFAPYSLALSPDGSRVWVGLSANMNRVLAGFDTARGAWDPSRILRQFPGYPWFPGFSADGSTLVVPTQNQGAVVMLRDGVTPTVLRTVNFTESMCVLPHQVALGPDGLYYLVCEGVWSAQRQVPGNVLALHPDDLRVVARYDVGFVPDAIVFDPAVAP
jgi:DNA-binding beta-propeller fold protein YncE